MERAPLYALVLLDNPEYLQLWSCSKKLLPAQRLLFSMALSDNKLFPVPVSATKSTVENSASKVKRE